MSSREQVDVGIRIGPPPDNGFIVKTIAPLHMQTAMSPDLLARLGAPQSVADLQQRYPLLGLVNSNNGKIFEWDTPKAALCPSARLFSATSSTAPSKPFYTGAWWASSPSLACTASSKTAA
ncbi:MAG: hypothetical protein KAY44_01670 [Neisseria sp.]|nr:hypothetical protein [Neisseria sp.]MBP8045297.1 hypothetical protein [Neisseria sp.]